MMFQKKFDRAMDWLKEKNKPEKEMNEWEELPFEKEDKIAIVISGIIVIGPIFIVLALILFFVSKI